MECTSRPSRSLAFILLTILSREWQPPFGDLRRTRMQCTSWHLWPLALTLSLTLSPYLGTHRHTLICHALVVLTRILNLTVFLNLGTRLCF
ncbi:hypothetical protein C8J57DRAFT_1319860 [Mycena rebaudengoi]|nr:hypothetical protein C8J57DRAFT_1377557 [Mycena rebaudengoi]KAJ7270828.1 hypothetical protein C8J57DRAFT_1319860 [Mycena rebaudengoi]